jgi:hypothetical protein
VKQIPARKPLSHPRAAAATVTDIMRPPPTTAGQSDHGDGLVLRGLSVLPVILSPQRRPSADDQRAARKADIACRDDRGAVTVGTPTAEGVS